MRLYLSVFIGLCLCPHAALAKAALETEIRSVETESTDIFGIFETLSNAQTALDRRDYNCLLYTSPSPRDLSTSRMPSSA